MDTRVQVQVELEEEEERGQAQFQITATPLARRERRRSLAQSSRLECVVVREMAGEDSDVPQFKPATIHEIFKLELDPSTRVTAPALQLSAEYLRLFTTEALHRSAEIANKEIAEGKAKGGLIEVRHLEKVTPGLLLDF